MFTSIIKSFNSVAAEQPTRPAVCQDGKVITYGELDAKATCLAHALRTADVGSSSLVGLCLEQSIDFVVGALGIIKCGAAYVPLDPALPSARLDFMIHDAGIGGIVTASHHKSRVSPGVPMLLMDSLPSSALDLPPVDPKPDQLAYLMYTSGTTGKPKGVEITHRGLANLVQWCRKAFRVVPADRTTLFAPVGFDASVRELWPHLTSGCTLVIPPEGLLRNPEELQEWLVLNEITISYLPTLLASRLVRMSWPEGAKLRYVYTGGDALRDYPIRGLPFLFVNEYGPAECTVFACSGIVPDLGNSMQPPSIGRPIDGARIYLLDDELAEVPAGETGEIYIGGEGLARGYRNNPELTNRSFIQGIHGESRGKRIYKTGDLGRYNGDGELSFLGRNDDQVKIRGYRIECGEVETSINQLEGVQASAVVKRKFGASDYRLVAYVVASADGKLTRETLRGLLRARLPEYMIPDEFVQMGELPLTSNGKIDKASLPDPHDGITIRNTEVSESAVERQLILILQNLLGVRQVGRKDNIFYLGGNSFVAMQLIAQIKRVFKITLTPRDIFTKPTAADLALEIEQVIMTRMTAAL
jgi:amino acid adenylation domain-containing protein